VTWQPSASLAVIRERARVYRQCRAFFNTRGCLEVDTPLILPATNTDPNIESFDVADRPGFLQTSPEFAMKRLLSAGCESIFQICHAFRQGEAGKLHHPEFTLLEWYRVDYDYQRLMDEMELLITTLSLSQCEFSRISYRQLFQRELKLDLDEIELPLLRRRSAELVPGSDCEKLEFDQCLDLLMGVAIAPRLQGYQFVYDYPVSQAALARVSDDDPRVAERFELFFNGIELANGFSELTDAKQQRTRFEQDNEVRKLRGLRVHDIDESMLAALDAGLPNCAGVALGLDRLLMVLLDLDSIEQVLTFT
jgi:lysyl-tRNA synthetase class 2